jgi:hypothetical protein
MLAGRLAVPALNGRLAATALDHGIGPLLYRAAVERGEWTAVDPAVQALLARSAREAILTESIRHDHLQRVAEELSAARVEPLVFKGSALAHSHYAEPWLRTRGDTDLLVDAGEVERADAVLRQLGLERLSRPEGRLVTYQARYATGAHAVEIAYDLHWRIADPHALADVLPYAELWAGSLPGPVPGTRRLGDVHALLAACVHRAVHHYDAVDLLLLYDLVLIGRRLSASEWQRFAAFAESRQLRALCRRGLALAEELFDACVPHEIRDRMAVAGAEPSAVFVSGRVNRLDVLCSDLLALPTWRDRAALLYEHAFPSRSYLLGGTAPQVRRPAASILPWAYACRIVRGLTAWRTPL